MKTKKNNSFKAAFLDRDGVLIEDIGYVCKKERVFPIIEAQEGLKLLRELEYKIIVITNQAAVAKGLCTEKEVVSLNHFISALFFKKAKTKIDGFYYCPHLPPEENSAKNEYIMDCDCRKPKPGLVFKAQKEFQIDLLSSFFIGDKTSDILCGKNSGLKTILVETGYGGKDGKFVIQPDFKVKNLHEAANLIKKIGEKNEVCI